MSDNSGKTVEQIVEAVVIPALEVLAPELGPAAPFVAALAPELPLLVAGIEAAIASGQSHGDAVIMAMDAWLAAKRKENDAALAAKQYP